jgi:formylglycine-generating enzyme required for sulfatase activity
MLIGVAFGIESGLARQSPAPPLIERTLSLPGGVKMDFARIEPGRFVMGCSAGDKECVKDESPVHPVRITKGFELGKYEVTQEQWF